MLRRALPLVLVSLAVLAFAPAEALAQRAIVLVRHAERMDDSTDAALAPAGVARARRLAVMLADAGVTAVYATQFQRTYETARPLAEKLKLPIRRLDDTQSAELISTLRASHASDVVLVVAHSHTIPEILKLLGHPDAVTIGSQEYDNLFVIMPRPAGAPTLLRIRF
jgi:broad specificity phosphatase PhoE